MATTTRSRSIYVRDLPATPRPGVQLYCPLCGGEYSAYRGDYFWMRPTEAFECGRCDVPLQLVQKRVVREPIEGRL